MDDNHGVTGELLGKFLCPAIRRNNGASVKEAYVSQIWFSGSFSFIPILFKLVKNK
jgi:hypothetical protein